MHPSDEAWIEYRVKELGWTREQAIEQLREWAEFKRAIEDGSRPNGPSEPR